MSIFLKFSLRSEEMYDSFHEILHGSAKLKPSSFSSAAYQLYKISNIQLTEASQRINQLSNWLRC